MWCGVCLLVYACDAVSCITSCCVAVCIGVLRWVVACCVVPWCVVSVPWCVVCGMAVYRGVAWRAVVGVAVCRVVLWPGVLGVALPGVVVMCGTLCCDAYGCWCVVWCGVVRCGVVP